MIIASELALYEASFKAMGSPCSLTLYARHRDEFSAWVQVCKKELERLEAKYSRYQPTSLLSQINAAAGSDDVFPLDAETEYLLRYADTAYEQSNGLFDISAGPLRRAWDFNSGVVPAQSTLDRLLNKIGWEKIPLVPEAFCLPLAGMELDFGGVVKEYAADRLVNGLADSGCHYGLVDLAGDMSAVGPHPDGRPWRIGIRNPVVPTDAVAHIALQSGGLASSGDYERCFDYQGRRYSHLLNPKTGWPVEGLASVSVWANSTVVAGSVSTIAMLKGEEEGLVWLEELGLPYIAVGQDGQCKGLEGVSS